MSFFPQLDLSQLVGLAIFGFCTGCGSACAVEVVHYFIEKMKKNKETLMKQLNHEVPNPS